MLELGADIGEVMWHPGESLEDLLHEADAAMYRNKHPGRTTLAPEITQPV